MKQFSFEDVGKRMLELYPDQERNLEGYEKVFAILQSKNKEDVGSMRLCIELRDNTRLDPNDTQKWHDVYGKDDSLMENFDGTIYKDENGNTYKQTWALEFQSWGYWANLPIDEDTLKNYAMLDIICHGLWEMTFMGFEEEEIQSCKDQINQDVEDIESGKAELLTFEELEKELKNENADS